MWLDVGFSIIVCYPVPKEFPRNVITGDIPLHGHKDV